MVVNDRSCWAANWMGHQAGALVHLGGDGGDLAISGDAGGTHGGTPKRVLVDSALSRDCDLCPLPRCGGERGGDGRTAAVREARGKPGGVRQGQGWCCKRTGWRWWVEGKPQTLATQQGGAHGPLPAMLLLPPNPHVRGSEPAILRVDEPASGPPLPAPGRGRRVGGEKACWVNWPPAWLVRRLLDRCRALNQSCGSPPMLTVRGHLVALHQLARRGTADGTGQR